MRESSNTSPLLCFVTAKAKPIKAKRSKEETITIIFLFVFIWNSRKRSGKTALILLSVGYLNDLALHLTKTQYCISNTQ